MQHITKYFPLSAQQAEQYAALQALYAEWNEKINVISRRDIEHLYVHHVLHSLAIARVFPLQGRVLDLGTGGGFPGIPLAIMFPEVQFTLLDSIGKKVRVAEAVAQRIGLQNVRCLHQNVVEHKDRDYDAVVSRAVCAAPELWRLSRRLLSKQGALVALKGGDVEAELAPLAQATRCVPISSLFDEEYFQEKYVVIVHP